MNTYQVEKYCSLCSENYNCPAYISMNFTQMYECVELQKTNTNNRVTNTKVNKNNNNKNKESADK